MFPGVNPATPFTDRVALLTVAGDAIGWSVAEQLGAAGAAVAVVATSGTRADAVVRRIRAAGGEAAGFTADLYDPGSLSGLIDRVERLVGEVDILVNDASTVAPLGPVADLDAEAVLRALAINVAGVVALAGSVIPAMRRRGWGRVVNVCRAAGNQTSWPGGNVYAACVAALEAHSVNLAAELTGTGISVNVLRARTVGTSLRAWLAELDPEAIDDPLIRRFVLSQNDAVVVDPDRSAATVLDHLTAMETGQVWDAVLR